MMENPCEKCQVGLETCRDVIGYCVKWHEYQGYLLGLADRENGWHQVIRECEHILGCPDTAEAPLRCNLPNLIRDLIVNHEKAKAEGAWMVVDFLTDYEGGNLMSAAGFNEKYGRQIGEYAMRHDGSKLVALYLRSQGIERP